MANKVSIDVVINDDGSVTLGKIADGLDKVGKKAKQAQGIFGEFASKLTSGLGIGAGFALGAAAADKMLGVIRSIPAEFQRIVDEGSKLSDLAAKTGVTTTALQQLQYAGSLVGVSLETATGAITRMQKALVDTPDKFQQLGLSAQELISMDPGEAFNEIALAIGAIPNPAERAAAAMRLFGKSGAELLPLISNMREAEVEAKLLGTTVAEEAITRLDAMGDAQTRAGAATDAFKTRLVAATVEFLHLDDAMNGVAVAVGSLNGALDSAGGGWMGATAGIAGYLAKMAILGPGIGPIISALQQQSAALYEVEAAAKAAGAAYSSKIFSPDLAMPGPQGASALELLNDQLRESQTETDKLARAHEKAAEAARKQAEADQALQGRLEALQAGMNVLSSGPGYMQPGMPDDNVKLGALSGNTNAGAYSQDEANARLKLQAEYQQDMARAADDTTKSTINWANELQQVSNQFAQLAGAGGPIGSILNMLAQAGNLTASVGSGLDSFNKGKTDKGFGGFLEQASGVIGIASAAFGFIGGLFNRGKKKREEEAAKRKQLLEDSENQLKQLSDQMDQAMTAFVQKGAAGVGAMFENIANGADGSAERMARLGRMGGMALDALRKQGLSTVEAMKQLGPTIDAALAAAKKSGKPLSGPLKELAEFKTKVDKNQKTVNAVDGLNDYVSMLRSTGSLTQETVGDVTGELAQFNKELQKAGFTPTQSLQLMAPVLHQLAEAEKQSGLQVDATTQALIDQAEAGGMFDGMTDPMQQLVDIQNQMLLVTAALAQAFGADLPASVQEYINKLNQIPPLQGPPGGGGTSPTPGTTTAPPDKGTPHYAGGGMVTHTGLAMMHGTPSKPEMVLNFDQMRKILAGRGGGVTGGVSIQPGGIIVHSKASDPKAVAQEVIIALERKRNPRLQTAVRGAARQVGR